MNVPGSRWKCLNDNFNVANAFPIVTRPFHANNFEIDQLSASSSFKRTRNQRHRDKDAYRSFIKRLSKVEAEIVLDGTAEGGELHDQTDTSAGKTPFKVQEEYEDAHVQMKGTTNNFEIPKQIQRIQQDDADGKHYEKRALFQKLMSPWYINKKRDSRNISRKRLSQKIDSKVIAKTIKKDKPRRSSKGLNEAEEKQAFFKTASFAQLKKYYNEVPAKTETNPVDFEVGTYLRLDRLEADFERIKAIRAENFSLVFKINQIQRTKGKTDNINKRSLGQSKYDALIQRIDKCEKENIKLFQRLENTQPVLPTRQQLEIVWKKNIEDMRFRSKYPLTLPGLIDDEGEMDEDDIDRPKVFLDFGLKDGNILGRVVLSLFLDLTQNTVMNFIALCENFRQNMNVNRISNEIHPHLAGSPLHRIFPDLYIEGGDIMDGNGCSGKAADGVDFFPDNLNISHDYDGTISMSPTADGRVNSLFAISFRPLTLLNGKRPAFGRVVKGLKVLKTIESFGAKNGRPKEKIMIRNCGLIQPN